MPPANDNFASAEVLSPSGGTFSGDTTGCTTESPITEENVWFSFTPGSTGWYSFWLDFGTISNPSMAVYSGASLGSLTLEDSYPAMCDTGPNEKRSTLLTGGVTYHLDLWTASPPGDDGTYTLNWGAYSAPVTGPSYDNIADALLLTSDGAPHTVSLTTVDSTMETNEFGHGSGEPGIWLKIDASGGVSTFTVDLDFTATGFNPFIDLWGVVTGFSESSPDWNLLSFEPAGNFWPGDGTTHPAPLTLTLDPADSDNGIFYLFVGDWDYNDSPCFTSPSTGPIDITYTIDGAVAAAAAGLARDHPVKLFCVQGGFDVAGIDGSFAETWSLATVALPDVESLGATNYHYHDELYDIGGRYYAVFASSNASTIGPYVYCYSIADDGSEMSWTQEFLVGGSAIDYNGVDWDAACDGTYVYVAVTTTHNTTAAHCPPTGSPASVSQTYIVPYRGVNGSWAALGTFSNADSFDLSTAAQEGTRFRMCASAVDSGNCYIAASDGGIAGGDANCGVIEQFWVDGHGDSPVIGTPLTSGRVYLETSSASPPFTAQVANALIETFDICNDGDEIQVFYRKRNDHNAPVDPDADQVDITIVKPATSPSSVATITTVGDDFWITPLWDEGAGLVQRALLTPFDAFGDNLRAVTADALTVNHFHGNTNLDVSHVPTNTPQPPIGVYYDTQGEYWMLYEGTAVLRSSVSNAKCPLPELWDFFTWVGSSGVALRSPQGLLVGESFFVLAQTDSDSSVMPAVVEVPICRNCMDCSNA